MAGNARPRKTQPKLASVSGRPLASRTLPDTPVVVGGEQVMVPVYELNGQTYSMPADMDPFFALEYQEALKNDGPLKANRALLIALFGEEAYADLRRARIGSKGFDSIYDRIGQVLLAGQGVGAEEPPTEAAAAGN